METSEKRGEKEMIILAFLIGGFIGMATMSIFSTRAYEKGYSDARKRLD
jgi:hypothetical protein